MALNRLQFLELSAEMFFDVWSNQSSIDLALKPSVLHAYKSMLVSALLRYSTGIRLVFTSALVRPNGLLASPVFLNELVNLLGSKQAPDIDLIGQSWRNLCNPAFTDWDFSKEARIFLRYWEQELQANEIFRTIAKQNPSQAIVSNSEEYLLINAEMQLASLLTLIDEGFGELATRFVRASPNIRDQIRDYTGYIQEKTRGFVGRQFVFEELQKFLDKNTHGYFIINGDPGIGKSALAAQLVRSRGYIHHFNIRAEGINKKSDFLKNICAQLIATYRLPYEVLPPEASHDGGFLNKLLTEVSAKLTVEKCVIVVDALDEADVSETTNGSNLLYLPTRLPVNIYFIVTTRRGISLRIESEHNTISLSQDDVGNIEDIRQYVTTQIRRDGIQDFIIRNDISDQVFIDFMVNKSQGNFIYVRFVLPEIENGKYKGLDFAAIPVGIQSYYDDHWRYMRHVDERDWFDYKLPVLIALTVVKTPVSLDLISEFSKILNKRRIQTVLNDWDQFLYKTIVEYQDGKQMHYRLYHSTFFDFIANKDMIADEHVNLKEASKRIAESLWKDLFDE